MDLIKFYMDRDGEASARESILMQFEVSLRSLLNAQSHATAREYRPRFVADALAMCDFLGHEVALPVIQLVLKKVTEKVGKMAPADAARATPFVRQFQEAVTAVAKKGAHARAVLQAMQEHPLDTVKTEVARKQLSINAADLESVVHLLQADNIPFSLS